MLLHMLSELQQLRQALNQRLHAKMWRQGNISQHVNTVRYALLFCYGLLKHCSWFNLRIMVGHREHRTDLFAGGTETTNRGISAGEPPVNSKQSAQLPRPRSRLWNHTNASVGEVDSLQTAINAFTVCSVSLLTLLSVIHHACILP